MALLDAIDAVMSAKSGGGWGAALSVLDSIANWNVPPGIYLGPWQPVKVKSQICCNFGSRRLGGYAARVFPFVG
jgi:hypothetical protein